MKKPFLDFEARKILREVPDTMFASVIRFGYEFAKLNRAFIRAQIIAKIISQSTNKAKFESGGIVSDKPNQSPFIKDGEQIINPKP